jgi:hypothetical protein
MSRWLSPGTPISSINKTDRHDITEILLKVALDTITPTSYINYQIDLAYSHDDRRLGLGSTYCRHFL